ncbi:MAG: alkanesulfonate monooxygenase SsuD [Gammaproteobacteria bacterium]|jgi:alkanesulfonate monooxygenase SsuD/methylene tetrahydromethanopterin reductase-like flavin-dependent oxidoreductase (luciferase family)
MQVGGDVTEIQFGLMIRGQFPQGDDLAVRFDEICAQARLAERSGFTCITKGSHYASAPLQDFQQIPFLSRLAAEVPSCRLNAGIVLLSLHKPLDIAEQIATLDVMSKGKAIFGCALGYREVEFLAFGTTQRERVPRLEESLEVIKRLWAGETVSMTGSHFELKEARTGIVPVQKPHPPIWMGANDDPAIKRAARLADCWYIPPHNRVDTIVRQLDVYKRELERVDRPFPQELPIRREVFVARTRAQALRLCGPSLALKYKTYDSWGQSDTLEDGDTLARELEALIEGRFIIGSPEEVADEIIELARTTGVNNVILSIHWPGMEIEVANDAIALFGEEVIPKVRQGL